MSDINRFMNFVHTEPNSGCWFWSGYLFRSGYGGFYHYIDGVRKLVRAHRFSYECFIGKVPKDKELDHLCRMKSCVNPNHLQPVTHKENIRRGICASSKKTHCLKGHPYSGDNLYMTPAGFRDCRKCRRQAGIRYRTKQCRA